jgi:hypothetical protein
VVLYESADDGVSVAVPAPELYDTVAATGDPPEGVSVNVDVVMVAAFIVSLNVTVTVALLATFEAPFTGATLATVGGVRSGAAAVVNVELNGVSALLDWSFAPLVRLTTYVVLYASAEDGVRVAVVLPAFMDSVAETGDPPCGVRVKVAPLIVAAFMASLNETTTVELIATLLAASSGVTAVTFGGVTSGAAAVVNTELN